MESDRTALLRKIVEQKTSGSQELFQFFGTSSTILAEAQPESDFDLGQAFETLFLAAQMMVDVLLDKFGYYFEEKFGTEFLDQFECNIFQLTMEDLSDLDAFLVEMTAPFLEREKSKLISRNASFLVQKMPNLWHTLHFMDPLELPTLEYVSPEFTRYFGWNICEIQSMSLSVIPMIDMSEIFAGFMHTASSELRAMLKPWDVPLQPIESPIRHITCMNGSSLRCKMFTTFIRDPTSRALYMLVEVLPDPKN
eukprot:TRINITY_DN10356_c0_g1_i2.p1 TRINITY_DN10356_c0_g1~~TRINITY_DN10356_c0_g1_i2.p1  ORF type:complete len:252 (-),score=60.35 TRINITY_DN10356_c0_g1_i2:91-846(-)